VHWCFPKNDGWGDGACPAIRLRSQVAAAGWRQQLIAGGGRAGATANLKGEMVVRFEDAPAGMRADSGQSSQPGLNITPKVGYRTLGRN
jgi:hypothetical protein